MESQIKTIKMKAQDNDRDWSMHFVDDSDYDTLYSENVIILKPDGQPLLVLLKKALSPDAVGQAWGVLKKLNPKTENRSTASGISGTPRIKQDGTKSSITRVPKGWEVISGILGYFERTPRFPFCHPCAWNQQNPDKFAQLFPMIKEVSNLFKKHVPDRWEIQKGFIDRTPKDFVIPDSVFTTLTINKNFRTACHKDAGDLEAGFSCLSVIREGSFAGGNLVLPQWRVAVKLDLYDLVMFDAHQFHGNTMIVPLSKNTVRCSIVYYYREMMCNCKSAAEELSFAKNKKLGEPLFEK